MACLPHETVQQWYERTIVADAYAAERLVSMQGASTAYNAAAEQMIQLASRRAAAEMKLAQAAFIVFRKKTLVTG